MNILEIEQAFAKAKAMPHSIERARLMLGVQRMASRSRARRAAEIKDWAHLVAVCALENYHGSDHATRSELGRIRAESQYLYNGLR